MRDIKKTLKEKINLFFTEFIDRMLPPNAVQWVGLYILVISIITTVVGHWEFHHAKKSVNWPSVTGIVIKSKVREYYEDDDNTPSYDAEIEYTYKIKGKYFTSDRINFESRGLSKEESEAIVTRYPLDLPATVFYSPENNSVSVLERGIFSTNYGVIICGYAMFVVGLTIFVVATVRYYDF